MIQPQTQLINLESLRIACFEAQQDGKQVFCLSDVPPQRRSPRRRLPFVETWSCLMSYVLDLNLDFSIVGVLTQKKISAAREYQ
jgi:hypothetical protein